MKNTRLFLISLLAFAIANDSYGRPLTLQEAIRFALDHSPLFDSAKKNKTIRDLEHTNSIASFLPSADISATHGLQNNLPVSGQNIIARNPTSPWFSALTLGVTENLYDNGESINKLAIAELNRETANLSFYKTRDSLALDIALEYYRLSLATALADVRKNQREVLEKQLKTLTGQYQQGLKTKMDYLRFKSQVQRAEIDLNAAKNSISLSIVELRKLLGQGLDDSLSLEFEPVLVTVSEIAIPQDPPLLQSNYDYRISKVQKEINERNVNFVKRRYWPQLSLVSEITYSNANYLNSNQPFAATDQLNWNALLTVKYNLWDWGSRRRDITIAENNKIVQDNALDQGNLEANARNKGLMLDLSRVGANYKLSRELVKLEEESYSHLASQYREGKVSYLDLITSQNNLLDSKIRFYTSYYETLQGMARYRFYEGKVYETIASQ